ncbi:MAG: rod shape-determining protein [Lachnospiraceae bacterium]|nr:rod shape-determining protein [Lachnospiraceae bacterium]
MAKGERYPGPLVFGLDIGTRSIVGTVGYMFNKKFHVIAIQSRLHETRAMLDGQIHDIAAVADAIMDVKAELQRKTGQPLSDVCIAAAGRVLRTVTVHVEHKFDEDTDVTAEHIYSLELLGAQKAYEEFLNSNTLNMRFYCVGYTVERYYLNKYPMGELLSHKGNEIGADVIATFLPDEVVDGLYKAVGMAGLNVANMTLEPIAAMELAIPKSYRMLNLALVDVGAGTSDISITRDGAIIAYGMIPSAGDELTEAIAKHFLTDFDEAERIKFGVNQKAAIEFTDIMGIKQKTDAREVQEILRPTASMIAREVSDQIKKLNGGKPVSAIFVVGGGGKVPVFTEILADEMQIARERVAVKGEEVLKGIDFRDERVKKDSLLVTPIGICLNFYNQVNNFIFVSFNGTQVKLYDNDHLQIVDAAMASGFPNADLFPKRGKEINYTVNGKQRVARGTMGEGAVITLNGETAPINAKIKAGDIIEVQPSTAGEPAVITIDSLPEYKQSIKINVNDKTVTMPKFAAVNGELQSGYYEIKSGDEVIMRDYYTVAQVLDFMDITKEDDSEIYVNHEEAYSDMPVYENFSVEIEIKQEELTGDPKENKNEPEKTENPEETDKTENTDSTKDAEKPEDTEDTGKSGSDEKEDEKKDDNEPLKETADEEKAQKEDTLKNESEEDGKADDLKEEEEKSAEMLKRNPDGTVDMTVRVNGGEVLLSGKKEYIYVDVFDKIDFDLKKPGGKSVVTKLNGLKISSFAEKLRPGDILEIYWQS